jgi:hypothetical protein
VSIIWDLDFISLYQKLCVAASDKFGGHHLRAATTFTLKRPGYSQFGSSCGRDVAIEGRRGHAEACAIWVTPMSGLASSALAASMSSSVSFGGRPPVRPARRAAARPAWVRPQDAALAKIFGDGVDVVIGAVGELDAAVADR